MTRIDETQHRLVEWTNGQHSERLSAQVLLNAGYQDLDPSHPYGGKDGGRDGVCTRDGKRYVMAVYFPRGQKTFTTVKQKLLGDLATARAHEPDGMVFVTNQEISLANRAKLVALAEDIEIVVFHMEMVAAALDQPHMHSIRQQYLDIVAAPPPLNITLGIDGTAHYFTNSELVRDGLMEWEIADIKKRAAAAREHSPTDRQRMQLMARAVGSREPAAPPTLEEEEAAIATIRTRMDRLWPRSENYLAVRVFPGLKFTVENRAESFLHKVQLVVTFHGAHGYEKEDVGTHLLDKILDPDFEPANWWEMDASAWSIPRLANDPVDFENVGDDLQVRIDLPELRPEPVTWKSGADEVVLVVPKQTESVQVSWVATASEYGTAQYGETITLGVEPIDMREALAHLLKPSSAEEDQ